MHTKPKPTTILHVLATTSTIMLFTLHFSSAQLVAVWPVRATGKFISFGGQGRHLGAGQSLAGTGLGLALGLAPSKRQSDRSNNNRVGTVAI